MLFILLAGSIVGFWAVVCVVPFVISVLAAIRVVIVFTRLCVRFFSFSLFLVLCALVLVMFCLAASRLCL